MKLFVCCSKRFYSYIPSIKEQLETMGHVITLPNSYDDPGHEDRLRTDPANHAAFKSAMLRLQAEKVAANDAILVLNFDKELYANYIGGATFLEMFKAFELQKKIFLYHPVPEGILRDEILGMQPIVVNEDLAKIRN